MGKDEAASSGRLDLALVHYPVCNKSRDIIGSAVTNLDLHDIARAGRTFGVGSFYVVTPYVDQQQLVSELLDHWLTGPGARANELRKKALELIRVYADLEAVLAGSDREGKQPVVLATSARPHGKQWSFGEARRKLETGGHLLLLFGTAWGLAPEVLARADGVLEPIKGGGDYNHLSVRSAAAIVLDRLLGTY